MKLIWTHEALVRLLEIEEFIAQDNPERAQKFVFQIIEHGESLSGKPLIGRMVPEISDPKIRELIFKNYRIIYRLRKNTIEILTVFEGHRLLRVDEITK